MVVNAFIRPYEVSLWTLQDSFIAVLKSPDNEYQGTLQEPILKLSDDGTEELIFTIPMYINAFDGQMIENPIWYNVINGNLIANMRKLKVIFNKNTEQEGVFELLITKIQEQHEDGKLTCEITTEGLPFHELGKQGLKCQLSYEVYEDDYLKWMEACENAETDENGRKINCPDEPKNNLSYWNEKLGFKRWVENEIHDPGIWYYDIQMDWSAYAEGRSRDTDKVYEEGYVSSWKTDNDTNEITPDKSKNYQEKYRIVELSNSNYYNITQDLAKEFGVFCRYDYMHDDNYHITAKRIIYYNNFINDREGKIDFSYPYQSSQISREMDSTDIVTKMYVDTVEDSTLMQDISITNSEANLSKEDYLLNFDYMYQVGAIQKDQYDAVSKFETQMHKLNTDIAKIDDYILNKSMQLPELEAELSLAKAGKQAAIKGINDTRTLLDAITNSDGDNDGIITGNIRTGYIVPDNRTSDNYSLNITEKGVLQESIEIFDTYDYSTPSAPFEEAQKFDSQNWTYEYDEFNNLIKINNISKPSVSDTNLIYLRYDYSPELYYKRIIDIWTKRLAQDEETVEKNTREINNINENIEAQNKIRQEKLEEKEQLKINFNKIMGPALREGTWKPENNKSYNKRKGHYIVFRLLDYEYDVKRAYALSLFWDSDLSLPGSSQDYDIFYDNDLGTVTKAYPCIKINSEMLKYIQRHKDEDLCIIYKYSENNEDANMKYIPIGTDCHFIFIKDKITEITIDAGEDFGTLKKREVFPAIVVYDNFKEYDLEHFKNNISLGTIITEDDENGNPKIVISSQYTFNISTDWVELNANQYEAVYPRFRISDNDLILTFGENDNETNLEVSFNRNKIKSYVDYTYFTTTTDGTFINFKPEILIYNGDLFSNSDQFGNNAGTIGVFYYVSTASTAYYLDAREVLKENSVPKVSYTVSTSVFNTDFMNTAYQKLNRIININDYELKFEDVQGYISSLELHLDAPWEDSIEVKNYKTKFEDLFASIIASTEAMQKNANVVSAAASALNPDGSIKDTSLQSALENANLNYSFNNGALTISNDKGIESENDGGVVAMRKGGIFTATDKDENGEWIWNSGITPQGINAQMITVGQLDTNRIIVQAGDQTKFQLNDKGLYAYKSLLEDKYIKDLSEADKAQLNLTEDVDKKQYVVHNADGLFLRVENGAKITQTNPEYVEGGELPSAILHTMEKSVDRVEISWDGLILRNFNGDEVFKADPNTGNLEITGTVVASGGQIGGWVVGEGGLVSQEEDEGEVVTTARITPRDGLNLFGKFVVNQEYLRLSTPVKQNLQTHNITNDADNINADSVSLISSIDDDNNYSTLAFYKGFFPTNDKVMEIKRDRIHIYENLYLNKEFQLKIGNTYSKLLVNNKINNNLIPQAIIDHVTNRGSNFSEGLYKFTTNNEGHVVAAVAVTKSDITALGIPAQDTVYTSATSSVDGLMSAADKSKLDSIANNAGVSNYTAITSATSDSSPNFGGSFIIEQTNQAVNGQVSLTNRTITIPNTVVSSTTNGLMISSDKVKLDAIAENAQVNTLESITVDDVVLIPDQNKNINIDLSHKADKLLLQMIAPEYDEEKVYLKDEFCIYEYGLYKAIDNFEEAEPWNPEHWFQTTLCEELVNLRQ